MFKHAAAAYSTHTHTHIISSVTGSAISMRHIPFKRKEKALFSWNFILLREKGERKSKYKISSDSVKCYESNEINSFDRIIQQWRWTGPRKRCHVISGPSDEKRRAIGMPRKKQSRRKNKWIDTEWEHVHILRIERINSKVASGILSPIRYLLSL